MNQHSFLVDFLNWRDVTRSFNKHEGSLKHFNTFNILCIDSITTIFFINPFIYTVYIYNK